MPAGAEYQSRRASLQEVPAVRSQCRGPRGPRARRRSPSPSCAWSTPAGSCRAAPLPPPPPPPPPPPGLCRGGGAGWGTRACSPSHPTSLPRRCPPLSAVAIPNPSSPKPHSGQSARHPTCRAHCVGELAVGQSARRLGSSAVEVRLARLLGNGAEHQQTHGRELVRELVQRVRVVLPEHLDLDHRVGGEVLIRRLEEDLPPEYNSHLVRAGGGRGQGCSNTAGGGAPASCCR